MTLSYKISNKALFLLVLLIVLVSKDTYFFGTNANTSFAFIATLYTFLLFVYFALQYFTGKREFPFSNNNIAVICSLTLFILLSGFVNGFEKWVLIRISTLLGGFFFAAVIPRERFCDVFERVILFISVFSIIAYLLFLFVPQVVTLFPAVTNVTGFKAYNLFITVLPIESQGRLFGPFREPGVFIIFLCTALFMHFCRNEQISIKRVAVFITALVLTMSTTGYITLAMLLLFYLVKHSSNLSFNVLFFVFLIVGAMLFLSVRTDLLDAEGTVFAKFDNIGRNSTISRLGSVFANLAIAKDYPLFGVGENLSNLFPVYCMKIFGFSSDHNTNTLLVQFAVFGIPYGALFLYGIFRFVKRFELNKLSLIIGFICLLLMFAGEDISENILLYIFVGYGYLIGRNKQKSRQKALDASCAVVEYK